MASQKEKLIAEALKLVEKGQYDRAVKTYLRVVAEDDKDVRIWLKIGDLYTKLRKNHEAAETYQRVAQFYSDQGFYTKAIAVYKQILKLDPSMVDVYERLAELYKQMGILPDAIEQYAAVAAHHQKSGDMRGALSALKQIVELDPQNVASRVKLAEMYSKEAMAREAIDEFAKAAEFLHEQARYDDYMKVAERLLFHSPDNRPVSRELARLYLQKGDARRALPRLQVCFKADPRDVETLSLLADAFDALGQKVKAVSVLKELVRIHAENGATSAADETWKRVLMLAPDDGEAVRAVGGLGPARREAHAPPAVPMNAPTATPPAQRSQPGFGTAASSGITPPPVPHAASSMPALNLNSAPAPRVRPATAEVPTVKRSDPPPPLSHTPPTVAPTPPTVAHTPPPSRPTPMAMAAQSTRGAVQQAALFTQTLTPMRDPTGPAGQTGPVPRITPSAMKVTGSQPLMLGIDDVEVAKILNETDVFMKYNLHVKAVEHVRTVFERDPYNVPAREKLKSILVTLERPAEAIEELKQLVQLRAGTPMEAEHLRELLALSPGEQWARDRLMVVDGGGGAVMQPVELEEPTEELSIEAEETTAEVEPEPAPPVQRVAAEMPMDLEVDLDGVEELSSDDLEAADVEEAPMEVSFDEGLAAPARAVIAPPPPETSMVDLSFDEPAEETAAGYDDGIPMVIDNPPEPAQVMAAGALEVEDRFGADLDEEAPSERLDVDAAMIEEDSAEEMAPPPAPPEVPAAEAVDNFDFSSFDDPSVAPPPPPAPVVAADSESYSDFDDPSVAVAPPLAAAREHSRPRIVTPPPPDMFAESEPDEATPQTIIVEDSGPATAGIEDELEEAEFYVQQNMLDEARDLLGQLLGRYPAHPLVLARLADLDAAPAADGGDLTVAMALDEVVQTTTVTAIVPGDDYSAAPEIVAPATSTRKNVVEKGINEDDFESHFELGNAYRSMGLIDNAISEFQLVMKDPTRQVQCREMLGLCYLDKGNTHEAIANFRQGLHVEGIHEDAELSLYYELAQAYERLSDTIEALYYYERISKRKPRYRDVERRIKLLAPPAADAL